MGVDLNVNGIRANSFHDVHRPSYASPFILIAPLIKNMGPNSELMREVLGREIFYCFLIVLFVLKFVRKCRWTRQGDR